MFKYGSHLIINSWDLEHVEYDGSVSITSNSKKCKQLFYEKQYLHGVSLLCMILILKMNVLGGISPLSVKLYPILQPSTSISSVLILKNYEVLLKMFLSHHSLLLEKRSIYSSI